MNHGSHPPAPSAPGLSLLVLACVLLAHLPWLVLPPVNLEFAFVDAARYLGGGDGRLLDQYFRYQANGLGFPFLGHVALTLSPYGDPLLMLRLVSLSGVVLLWLGVRNLARQGRRQDAYALQALILLNPLVWIFAGRATADFFPAALSIFAVSLALDDEPSNRRAVWAGLLLGVAAILKYHALLLGVHVLLVSAGHRRAPRLLGPRLVVALASVLVAGYVWALHRAFGFWVTPPTFQDVHRLSLGSGLHNLIGYCGFLVGLTLPFAVGMPAAAALTARHWRALLVTVLTVFTVGAVALQVQGEMGLGPLDRLLGSRLLGGAFLVLCSAILIPLLPGESGNTEADRWRRRLLAATLLALVALALTRPAQRYLLFLLPLQLLALPIDISRRPRSLLATLTVLALMNGLLGYSQWCSGTAAQQLADRIEAAGLLRVTDPGPIGSHVGNRFFQAAGHGPPVAPRYVVREGVVSGAMFTETRGVSVLAKAYSLVHLSTN